MGALYIIAFLALIEALVIVSGKVYEKWRTSHTEFLPRIPIGARLILIFSAVFIPLGAAGTRLRQLFEP